MRTTLWILLFLLQFTQVKSQERSVTLLFAGDAMQHLPQIHSARGEDGLYQYDSCFHLLKEKISNADLVGVNFETTLGGEPYSGYPLFSAPDAFATALRDSGFDIFFQANNHAVDRGRRGVERTIQVLDSLGIRHTGTFADPEKRSLYYPLMVIQNGIRIAFLNYSYDTNGLPVKEPNVVNLIDSVQIVRDLKMAELYKPDIIVAQLHWGEEYRINPSQQQQTIADLLLRKGVQIIIGHHPHVVQPMKVEKDQGEIRNVVYYSLGNFISNQQQELTDGGMLAEIVIRMKDEESPAVIDTCGYSLVWVEKTAHDDGIRYRLIPWPYESLPSMKEEDQQRMHNFVKRAEQIITMYN
ncbi:CapA family protein [Dysgonomonadaceae bacterium zrk40]|nr:CapA family protein [Dysgonomonadaceae bacterium zrk40]